MFLIQQTGSTSPPENYTFVVFNFGKSTLCKMLPKSKIIKNSKVVQKYIPFPVPNTQGGPKVFPLGAKPAIWSYIKSPKINNW